MMAMLVSDISNAPMKKDAAVIATPPKNGINDRSRCFQP